MIFIIDIPIQTRIIACFLLKPIFVMSWLSVFCILTSTIYSSHTTPSNQVSNKIDYCWRSNPNWANDRQALAGCAVGFGSGALISGKGGAIYVVTEKSDDPMNPKQGTLRCQSNSHFGLCSKGTRVFVNELIVNSYKTNDAKELGSRYPMVHGVLLHDFKPSPPGNFMQRREYHFRPDNLYKFLLSYY